MCVIGVLGQFVFFAQAQKIFFTKSAKDVSAFGFTFGFLSVSSWLVYGIIKKSTPLILANTIAVLGSISVLVGIMLYG